MRKIIIGIALLTVCLQSFAQNRIVSLNGTTSEILCALGLEKNIVGVDITSTYPRSLAEKPMIGHTRNIGAEGILALRPTTVVGLDGSIKSSVIEQLKSAGIKVSLYKYELSSNGVKNLTNTVAKDFAVSTAPAIIKAFEAKMNALKLTKTAKKVLFIYARGAGTLLVSGTGTPIARMIELAGARNAVTEFSDYKPLTPEGLFAADPDVILLFSSGLESLNGNAGLMKVPGISETKAAKTKKIISMDGELLSGFSLRLPEAIKELNSKI